MKRIARHSIILAFLPLTWVMCPVSAHAQEQPGAYYFENEEIVFVFDIRAYARALLGENALKVDFADLGIYDVAVTGQFNNWSRKDWKMSRRDDFIFELRKRIQDFNDAFPLDFRYIINDRYIADPEGRITNPRHFTDNFLEDVYKVDLSVIEVADEGNITFFLKAYPNARQVVLSGSFNGWNEQAIAMNKVSDGWKLHAKLPPGRYEYKFIVDGEWIHDPANTETVVNQHHTLNSVLHVTVPVTFVLAGYPDAKTVVLTGSFNNWDERKLRMRRENNEWKITLDLVGGKHTYKFIVDGIWITDPGNRLIENDGNGNMNSVRFVH